MHTRQSAALATLAVLLALAPAYAHVVQHCPEADHCSRRSPCNDGDPCTLDVCELADNGEGCCEHESISPCLDTFLCYDVATAGDARDLSPVPDVRLVNRLEDQRYRVNEARGLCNPADRGAGIHDAGTRLQRHQIAPVASGSAVLVAKGVKVQTDLGAVLLDVMRSDELLVPAALDLLGPPAPTAARVDRLTCHAVKPSQEAPRFPKGLHLKLGGHFTDAPKVFAVTGPEHLCTAVDANGAGVVDTCAALLCYRVKAMSKEPAFAPVKGIWVRDEFALQQVDAIAEGEACLPAVVNERTCLPKSYACDADADCTTNHCVDGVCCESACTTPCHACLGALTGQPHGTCAPIALGGDAERCGN